MNIYLKRNALINNLVLVLSILSILILFTTNSQANALNNSKNTRQQIELNKGLPLVGVAISSAEWAINSDGQGANPGIHGKNYIWPDAKYVEGYESVKEYMNMGMTTIRLPFRWERLQPTLNQPFALLEHERLTTTVNGMLEDGAYVILDIHNYARYGEQVINGSNSNKTTGLWASITDKFKTASISNQEFSDLWRRLAQQYKNEPKVIFGLMNEPMKMLTENWLSAANAAISAIRETGAENLILVPGNAWTGAHSWMQNWYGTANADVMLKVYDPLNYFAYEVHQYMDEISSWSETCVSKTIGSERMHAFTKWLIKHDKRAFLGEFFANDDDTCLAALEDQLSYLEKYASYYIGWSWWGGGPRCVDWVKPIDPFCREGEPDSPQMKILRKHLDSYQ